MSEVRARTKKSEFLLFDVDMSEFLRKSSDCRPRRTPRQARNTATMKLYTITFLSGSVTSISAESYQQNAASISFIVERRIVAMFFVHALISIQEVQPA